MFGSPIPEVIVALAFVYFALSTIVSNINERVAGILAWRSKDLVKGLQILLAEPSLTEAVWLHPLIRGIGGKPGRGPSYIPSATFALALLDTLALGKAFAEPGQLRQVFERLREGSARRALLAIYDAADGDVARTRQGVEAWFNSAMDRLSGEYKRRLQWFTLFVAAAVATALGVDTIAFAQGLWHDAGLRAGLVAAAQSSSSPDSQHALDMLTGLNPVLGWAHWPTTPVGWLVKAAGILITTLAISLGAPFWFDLLQKFVNPRAAGPKPEHDPATGLAKPG